MIALFSLCVLPGERCRGAGTEKFDFFPFTCGYLEYRF